MKRFTLAGSLLMVPALAIALTVLPGCSGGGKNEKGGDKSQAKADKGDGKAEAKGDGKVVLISSPTTGVIKGQVLYSGEPPTLPPEKRMDDHADAKVCLSAEAALHEKIDQTWIISKNNGVANVVVWLQPPEGKGFSISDEVVKQFKDSPAVIDQPHCAFVPHVVALFPEYKDAKGKTQKTGQKLLVKNSAEISHNTNISGDERKNPPLNINVNPKQEEPISLKYQKDPLNVKCDKHPWMYAKVHTFNQPYFAVTDANGNFEIKNVPTDAELNVVMWHEATGQVAADKQSFKAGDNELKLKISKK